MQNLHVIAMLRRGASLITLILDRVGFGKPLFSKEHTYSHNPHPVHLSGLIEMKRLPSTFRFLLPKAFTQGL